MSLKSILIAVFHFLIDWITKAEHAILPVVTIAEELLNGLKKFDGSVVGQTIEGLIEQYIPATTGLINAFHLQLPIWLVELKWIEDEGNKTLAEQWADAQAYLNSIQDANVKAAQLNSLKALFINFFGQNSEYVIDNTTPMSIQHALVLATPTHHPELFQQA